MILFSRTYYFIRAIRTALISFIKRSIKIQYDNVVQFIQNWMIPKNKISLFCAIITLTTAAFRIFDSPVVLLQSPVISKRKDTCETRSVRHQSLRDTLEHLIGGRYSFCQSALELISGFNGHYLNIIISRLYTWRRHKAKKKSLAISQRANDVFVDPSTSDRMKVMTEILQDKSLYEELFQKLKASLYEDNLMRDHYQSMIPLVSTNGLAVVDWIGYAELYAMYAEVIDERDERERGSTFLTEVMRIIDDMRDLVLILYDPHTFNIEIDISKTRKPYRPLRGGFPWQCSRNINVCLGMGPQRKDYSSNLIDLIVDGVLLRRKVLDLPVL